MLKKNLRNKIPYKILITDILIIFLMVLISIFVSKGMFSYHSPFSRQTSLGIYLPLSLCIISLTVFLLYVEYKYNNLSFKNVFLLLGFLVAINNMIATLSLPFETYIQYSPRPYVITGIDKLYSIIYGFIIGFLPFMLTILFPKKVNNKTYLKYVLYTFVIVVSISILASLIIDFNSYLNILKSKFADLKSTPGSFFLNKNIFGWFLFAGMTSAVTLHILTKKWHWILVLLLFYGFIIFTFSKSSMIVGLLLLLIYLITNVIFMAKKNHTNLILTILISSFAVMIAATLITFTVNSQSGLLFLLKKVINQAAEQGKTTLSTRLLIWKCTINLLKPYQFVFGFGMTLVGKAISIAYGSHPDCTEKPATGITNAHNAFLEIIAEGGAIYLLIYLCYLVILFYMAIKIYRKNKMMSIMFISYLLLFCLLGVTGQDIFYGDTINIFFTIWIIVPLASVYFMNQKPVNSKKIANQIKEIKQIKYSNFLLKFNQSRCILNLKNILKDSTNRKIKNF